jgi:hypothetical protein
MITEAGGLSAARANPSSLRVRLETLKAASGLGVTSAFVYPFFVPRYADVWLSPTFIQDL